MEVQKWEVEAIPSDGFSVLCEVRSKVIPERVGAEDTTRYFLLENNTSSSEHPDSFHTLEALDAGGNNFLCSCEFLSFTQEQRALVQILIDWPENYLCDSPFSVRGQQVQDTRLPASECHRAALVSAVVSVLLLLLLLTGVLCHRCHGLWYLKMMWAWLQAKRKPRKVPPRDLGYDAFVSYSERDAYWVENLMVQELEHFDPPFRLCLHKRDFIPGKWIIDNIIDSIEKSHKTIFVLSENFVKSEWCKYGLDVSHFQLFDENNDAAILILLEPSWEKGQPPTGSESIAMLVGADAGDILAREYMLKQDRVRSMNLSSRGWSETEGNLKTAFPGTGGFECQSFKKILVGPSALLGPGRHAASRHLRQGHLTQPGANAGGAGPQRRACAPSSGLTAPCAAARLADGRSQQPARRDIRPAHFSFRCSPRPRRVASGGGEEARTDGGSVISQVRRAARSRRRARKLPPQPCAGVRWAQTRSRGIPASLSPARGARGWPAGRAGVGGRAPGHQDPTRRPGLRATRLSERGRRRSGYQCHVAYQTRLTVLKVMKDETENFGRELETIKNDIVDGEKNQREVK
uniref:uncharacterized protein LOC101367407 n=1 Tax=Odobenus rosmarus divergens TaxID=9708 RepID=UPI00063CA7BE|nr:PREDICTED: uncharacterized protein LOC101367407 [Odobenus rosmarus divergens]